VDGHARAGDRYQNSDRLGDSPLHAKVLAWDDDALAVTSLNRHPADPSETAIRSEIVIFFETNKLANTFVRRPMRDCIAYPTAVTLDRAAVIKHLTFVPEPRKIPVTPRSRHAEEDFSPCQISERIL
jgi:hypothetical protein